MSTPVCKLSVVCPAFDEEEVLPCFHAELCAELGKLGPGYEVEILYVDDGSRDQTLSLLRRLALADGRVRYLSLSRNFGNQAAITAGLEHARGDVVITLDSDLQHPPALIPKLLARWREGHDIVLTLREEEPSLHWGRRTLSAGFYKIMDLFSDTAMRASASDYRLMTRKVVVALLRLQETHRFLRGLVSWLGFSTATVAFTPPERGGGRSKFTMRRLVSFAFDAMLSFSKLPVRLPLFAGVGSWSLALLLACGALVRLLVTPAATDWNWLTLELTLLLLGGAMLVSVGLLGEYVGRTYEQVKARPLYLVKEAYPDPAGALPYQTRSEGASAA
jgi:glycosyltransferase involved in cell wall biosynthesis